MKQRKPIIHGRDHSRGGADPIPPLATLHIKLFPDEDLQTLQNVLLPVAAGTGLFVFAIAEDMHGMTLTRVEAFVTTPSSSGPVQVQVRNRTQSVYLLTTAVQVDAGELNSRTAATAAVINNLAVNLWADEISIDVVAAGSGAKGLGVILEFSMLVASVPSQYLDVTGSSYSALQASHPTYDALLAG